LKILMLSKALLRGTYQRKLEELAALPGVDQLSVIVPPFWREKNVEIVKLEKVHMSGYELIVEPMLLNGSYHLHFYSGLAKWLKRLKPDIFHVDEESFNLATWQGVRLGQRYNVPSVFYNYANIYRDYPFPFSYFESYNFRHASAAFTCNQEAFDILRRRGFQKPIDIVPQVGVDPEFFKRTDPPTGFGRPDLFTIGYAGRLIEEKGLESLIAAAAQLQGDFRVVLVGSGPLKERLQAQAAQLGIATKIEYVGSVASTLIPNYFSGFDVLVLPSLTRSNWKEQYGRVLQEAMACGTPVVGSSSGEIPNVIAEAGLIFPEGDASALAGCLQKLLDNRSLRQTLSVRGLERVQANFTQAQVAARHFALYQKALTSLT
jgi:glycosyltransferase involved in cell wall biosynthesis